jgi:hypothetical protein
MRHVADCDLTDAGGWRLAADGMSYLAEDSFAHRGSSVVHESDRSHWFGLNPLIERQWLEAFTIARLTVRWTCNRGGRKLQNTLSFRLNSGQSNFLEGFNPSMPSRVDDGRPSWHSVEAVSYLAEDSFAYGMSKSEYQGQKQPWPCSLASVTSAMHIGSFDASATHW